MRRPLGLSVPGSSSTAAAAAAASRVYLPQQQASCLYSDIERRAQYRSNYFTLKHWQCYDQRCRFIALVKLRIISEDANKQTV